VLSNLIIDGIKQQRVVTSVNSSGYTAWVSSDYKDAPPQYFNVYIWHVQNPYMVMAGLEKPKLEQIGPFIYEYHTHFFNITWDTENHNWVKNMQFQRYNFQRKGSYNDPKQTNVTVLNVPYAAVRSNVDPYMDWYTALEFDLLTSAANQELFINVTVDEFVWGFQSPFLEWINENVQPGTKTEFALQTNDTSEDEKYKALNGTHDIYFTGNNGTDLLNEYAQWHGMRDLKVWGSEDANKVRGTDGTGFGINIPDNVNMTVFVDTLYRHLGIWHNMTEDVKGITLRRYWLEPSNFFNISQNPAYHLNAKQGLSNMTAVEEVLQGTPLPLFMSLPVFFQSDESYLQAVQFVNAAPNISLHNTEIMVEPITGITMKAAKRIQVNCKINPTFLLYPTINTTYFPVAWFELESTISDPLADQWKNTVGLATKVHYYCPFVMGAIGVVFGGLTLYSVVLSMRLKKRAQSLLRRTADIQ